MVRAVYTVFLNQLSLHRYGLFQIKIIFTIWWSSNACTFSGRSQKVAQKTGRRQTMHNSVKGPAACTEEQWLWSDVQKGKSGTMSSEGIQSSQTNDCRRYYVRRAYYQLIIWPRQAELSTNLAPRGASRAKGLQLPHSPRSPVSPHSWHQNQGRGRRKRGWREWADPLNILKEKTHWKWRHYTALQKWPFVLP